VTANQLVKGKHLSKPANTYEHAGLHVEILCDYQTGSPLRKNRLGTIIAWADPDIQFGDQQLDLEWTNPQEVVADLKRRGTRVVLPLFYPSHGRRPQCGVNIRDAFDDNALNSSCGVVYVTAERIRAVFGVTRITATVLFKAREQLGKELTEYNYFLMNDKYGYVIRDRQKNVIARKFGIPGLLECEAAANEAAEDCAKAAERLASIEGRLSCIRHSIRVEPRLTERTPRGDEVIGVFAHLGEFADTAYRPIPVSVQIGTVSMTANGEATLALASAFTFLVD
jgi:hypothetical protein